VNSDAKKAVLRMIRYGIYVLTADDGNGNIAAATVNWVTQSAFAPPLVVVGVKADSGTYKIVRLARGSYDLRRANQTKTWMPATSAGMTNGGT
jgi:flavin reductase (DIM6/NTAB) family NADH-FMN oxidoreductase RutF